ncbi:MAG: tRNA glutamyl-Q(34) synthetase GluQRS [Albidovulum sp.]|nr:tRNA glutamyl-Q(34) synthetase GluQRS [Albidovulum sp.]MDE0532891.1 tRNA glutamyl-Q(34) synthetase GluQRS [Albidovulum sp.]
MIRERFAPSPTGYLHLGHAYSAAIAWRSARSGAGQFLLRIENIDVERCRAEFERAIYEDLAWLGFSWASPVMRQSERSSAYAAALEKLIDLGICYPCGCSRKDIRQSLSAPQENRPGKSPLRPTATYPGTCRSRSMRGKTDEDAIRINLNKAFDLLGGSSSIRNLEWVETGVERKGVHRLDPEFLESLHGDFVLARKFVGTSYHLACVVDDSEQRISRVTRGMDLVDSTPAHRLLQELLGIEPPVWHHHPLVRDENGKRLAKRDDARAIRKFRDDGLCPTEIFKLSGVPQL